MKPFLAIISVALICCCSSTLTFAAPDQPRMRAAIDLLNAAKTAESPLPVLRAAKKKLHEARPNKHGERLDAIEAVNEAIALATVGDKNKMVQKIDHAVAQVYSGMRKAR